MAEFNVWSEGSNKNVFVCFSLVRFPGVHSVLGSALLFRNIRATYILIIMHHYIISILCFTPSYNVYVMFVTYTYIIFTFNLVEYYPGGNTVMGQLLYAQTVCIHSKYIFSIIYSIIIH